MCALQHLQLAGLLQVQSARVSPVAIAAAAAAASADAGKVGAVPVAVLVANRMRMAGRVHGLRHDLVCGGLATAAGQALQTEHAAERERHESCHQRLTGHHGNGSETQSHQHALHHDAGSDESLHAALLAKLVLASLLQAGVVQQPKAQDARLQNVLQLGQNIAIESRIRIAGIAACDLCKYAAICEYTTSL